MSILARYVSRRLLLYYLGLVLMMMAFFVFFDFMEHIERVTRGSAPANLIALYYAYYLPRVFIETSWISFLVAMLLVLGILAKNNEFIAMLAGGISIYRISAPLIIAGCILTGAVFCTQEFVVPLTMLRAYELKDAKFKDKPDDKQISDIAEIGRRNQLYYFETLDPERGILTGVQIHTRDGGTIVSRIDAERAVWDKSEERWFLENAVIREFDTEGAVIRRTELKSMKAPFKESPSTIKMHGSSRGEFNFIQLRNYIKNLERSGYPASRLKLDYQKKFALPFANVIVVLLCLPFALQCRRGGLILGFALSLGAALLYFGTFQISLALGNSGILPAPVAAWLANFLFLGVGTTLTLRAQT